MDLSTLQERIGCWEYYLQKTATSGLVDENGKKCKWNIYNKLWLSEQQEKGVVPSNLITDYENRQSAAELKQLQLKFEYAKPVRLVEYLLTIAQLDKDVIVLDSFAGSGTTAHAVLNMNKTDGGKRQFILVEMGEYANEVTAERVKRVIQGYGEGKKAIEGTGGDFSYYELGEPLLISDCLNEAVSIEKIREYIWFMETKSPYVPVTGNNPYYLGQHNHTGYYFYYEPQKVTVLDYGFLATITEKNDGTIIYADRCSIGEDKLSQMGIVFKKIPRDISRL